jgi:pyridoxal phosphate enzyme (YggS family)
LALHQPLSDPAIEDRFHAIEQRIAAAASNAGRSRSEIELIVVSKFHPASLVLDLLKLGQRNFGENKDQEAKPKFETVRATLASDSSLKEIPNPIVHFVGQLQSNKAKSVIRYCQAIHSLDRDSLLKTLASARQSEEFLEKAPTDVFIELNLTDNPERGGIAPAELIDFAERVLAVEGLNLLGVMGVASLEAELERDFETIARASQTVVNLKPEARFISAGMSGDFETAIGFGATHLRIGTAITGERNYLA